MHPNKNLLEKVFRFTDDHPEEYEAVRKLVAKATDNQFPEDELHYQLGVVVYSHRLDTRGNYLYRANSIIAKIDNLEITLLGLEHDLSQMDGIHASRASKFFGANYPHLHLTPIRESLPPLRNSMIALREGVRAAIETEKRPSGRSRPQLPNLAPTAELADAWERLTGLPILAPKGTAPSRKSKEATQPSTEFIRLGLKMIDPNTTIANTMTLIKRVRALAKKYPDRRYAAAVDPYHSWYEPSSEEQ